MPAPEMPPVLTGLEPPGATEPMGQISFGSGIHQIVVHRTFPQIEEMSVNPDSPWWDPEYYGEPAHKSAKADKEDKPDA